MDSTQAKNWLISIIRIRKRLIRTEKNKRNVMQMINDCEKLTKELEYFNPSGDRIINFIRSRSGTIMRIIPGNKSEMKNIKILQSI